MAKLFGGRDGANSQVKRKDLTPSLQTIAYVYEVILDESHPLLKDVVNKAALIGTIRFRTGDGAVSPDTNLPIAIPLEKQFKSLPVINELVEIHEITPNQYGYRRIGIEINPSRTNSQNNISVFQPQPSDGQKLNEYREGFATATPTVDPNELPTKKGFGNYYTPQDNIHKLKLYEGDSLIESRFGQSVRFSAYNNLNGETGQDGKIKPAFAPTLILRNGESALNRKKTEESSVEEDINRDGSIIAMTSGQHQLAFQPGTVDDNGKSDFETKPQSFENYPSKLIGDQLVINSGRVIISSKNAEMMFFSKKNYGFVSDGAMSIDNKLGIDVSVGDNINVITNDRDILMYTGKGSIFLGNTELEPIVKGQQLVDILSQLIDAITNQVFLTPSGPTKVGPENVSEFGGIKSKLNNILSKLNQTS
jgi:hypothetical protein